MQVKIGLTFHRDEITYFEMNRLYAYVKQIQEAGYMGRNYNYTIKTESL